MAYLPPVPNLSLRREFRKFVRGFLVENLTPFDFLEVLDFREWAENTGYTALRIAQLEQTYNKILEDSSMFANDEMFMDWITKNPAYMNAKVDVFTKEEYYVEPKTPRAIWARNDKMKVISGPFFKKIEKVVYKLPFFIKNIPKNERPMYIRDFVYSEGMQYNETDYTSFESLFTPDLMYDCEFQLYKYMSMNNPLMKRLCRMLFTILAGINFASTPYFKILVDAKRMSGEMNTSLGNGFSNLMFLLFAAHKYEIRMTGPVIEGDDALSGTAVPIPSQYFVDMGLNVKLIRHSNITEAAFCGIVCDMDELINVTDPIKILTTFSWVPSKYAFCSKTKYYELMKSKALSIAYEYPGCPILDKFARRVLYVLRSYKYCHDASDNWKFRVACEAANALNKSTFPVKICGLRTRYIMEKKFKITIADQLIIEKEVSAWTDKGWGGGVTMMAYVPDTWKQNYCKYTWDVESQTYDSVVHPMIPFGKPKINERINKLNNHQFNILMSQILTKKNYYKVNNQTFVGLTEKEKNDKYIAYLAKKNAKGTVLRKNQTPLRSVPKLRGMNQRVNQLRTIREPKISNMKLSECLLRYAQASVDPFSELDQPACIPDNIAVPSYKFSSMIQSFFNIGTLGTGWAIFNPWDMVVNDNASNGTSVDYPLVVTGSTYDKVDYDWDIADLNTTVSGVNSNSFFDSTQIYRGQIRLVAAGIECFYMGQLIDSAGTVATLQYDGLKVIPNPSTTSDIQNNPKTVVCGTSKAARCYVSYYPTNSDVLSYRDLALYRPSELDVLVYHPLIIYVTGATPSTQFQVKCVAHFELQIPGMHATASETDPIGFPALQAARSAHRVTDSPEDDLRSILQSTLRNVAKSVSGLAPQVGTAIGAAFGQPAIGGMMGSAAQAIMTNLLGGQTSSLGNRRS